MQKAYISRSLSSVYTFLSNNSANKPSAICSHACWMAGLETCLDGYLLPKASQPLQELLREREREATVALALTRADRVGLQDASAPSLAACADMRKDSVWGLASVAWRLEKQISGPSPSLSPLLPPPLLL